MKASGTEHVTEVFVLQLSDPEAALPVRATAKEAWLAVDGVESWRTYETLDDPTIVVDVVVYVDADTARSIAPQFSSIPETVAYLSMVRELTVERLTSEIA